MTPVEQLVTTTPVRPRRFTTSEFHKMVEAGILPEESGWEVIDGYLIDKMTIGSRHASVVKRLNKVLSNLLGDRYIIGIQDPIHIDDFNEPEPDISVLRSRDDFYSESHPGPDDVVLAIEISDTSANYDRNVKLSLYAKAGLAEVWLIDAANGCVEQFSSPVAGQYVTLTRYCSDETLHSVSISELAIEIDTILG